MEIITLPHSACAWIQWPWLDSICWAIGLCCGTAKPLIPSRKITVGGGYRSCWAPKDPGCLYLVFFFHTRRKSSSSSCYLLCSVSLVFLFFSWWRDDPSPCPNVTHIHWLSQLPTSTTAPNPAHHIIPAIWLDGWCHMPASPPSPPAPISPHVQTQRLKDKFTVHHLIRFLPISLSQTCIDQIGWLSISPGRMFGTLFKERREINGSLYGITAVRYIKTKISLGKKYFWISLERFALFPILQTHCCKPWCFSQWKDYPSVCMCVCLQFVVLQTWWHNTDWSRTFRW